MDDSILFIQTLQVNAPNLGLFMQAIAFLGQPEFYLLFIPLIYWCFDKTLGIRLALILSLSTGLCDALKISIHSPRPYWVSSDVKALTNYPSFGMPSGHAQNALVFFGYLAAWIKKMWAWIICTIIILLIGLARVYQAVHFPLDIITGWAVGLVILVLVLRFENPAAEWMCKKTLGVQIGVIFLCSVVLICISLLALVSLGSWQVPTVWSELALSQSGFPIDPLVPRDTLITAGLLFGAATGAVLANRYVKFTVSGTNAQKVLRYCIGIVILFVIWLGLSPLVQPQTYSGYLMTYLRPAVAGLWICAGAPRLFQKIGLYKTQL
ncbi:phosphatase PAP2 family protein [uncultured Methanoregula sp.]|uniref:phosphatase PAP2 family protein n=1 Tax=uncultured Methanoregula sp. TaxID=1005933 RepID=UPI002AAACBF2|nr:phosphatase PAP2 family protein [uncultured Methanoregula sp.]